MRDIPLRDVLSAASRAADQLVIGRAPTRGRDGTYLVPSAHSGEIYTVTLGEAGSFRATCTCPHGRRIAQGLEASGQCWHVVAALMDDAARSHVRRRKETAPTSAGAVAAAA